jgi:serine/threonine-protein kinase
MKDQPATVPERKRADATVVVPAQPPILPPGTTPPDSYQPEGGTTTSAMASHGPGASSIAPHELIVPSSASVGSILDEIRKRPAERLEIESRAAQGGMGAIDVAVDRALDRRIAIKTLHPHMRTSESSVRMFLREARLTGLLDHPHVVPVYDIGERDADHLYFAMKLVEGQTLAAIIRALPRGALDTATLYGLLDVVTKVCDALAFAHSRGVIHCDIKPANVMVGDFGQVYLMDWGIARLLASEPSPASAAQGQAGAQAPRPSATDNAIVGTPCYMSPEQARGDRSKLDARSDVFLMGALLYEVLTRQPPYASADRTETLSLAAVCSFPSPRKVAGEGAVPHELERIVMRAMAKNPADRYPSIAALREDLARFMRGGAEFPRKTYAAGSVIVREGDRGDVAYIIVTGRCQVKKEMPGGEEVLREIGPGDVFGEMAILTQGPRTASVVAVEDATVLVVSPAALEQEMSALKPWMATLLKSLATRFREIDTRHRATFATSPTTISLPRLANQVLMHVVTWGDLAADGSRSARWQDLTAELEAQLGLQPITVFAAISHYGMELDVEADRLTIPDPAALARRLKADLRR